MKTLAELLAAMERDEVTEVIAYLDNDLVIFRSNGGADDDADDLLRLHPYEVQQQALAALGIEAEAV